ncbi:MAG TPA: diheme cytochrome c-553 [Thermoanaerobaculia bacterium]|jgi:mono/diheme cytochrome c family protein|nr:diheme cytochrome c-553 [Thermoanaerobaculia bacterium]
MGPRNAHVVFAIAALVSAGLSAACRKEESSAPAQAEQSSAAATEATSDLVGGGRYLVTIMACNDCHTPYKMGKNGPEPDMSRMLSGHPEGLKMPPPPKVQEPWGMVGAATNTAWAGPWGMSYTANLTPDQNTGIGIWTEDMFIRAMRTGKHMGTSRTILPPMPWPWYAKMRDEELKAIFAYLKSIPPIHNRVPDPKPPAAPVSR